MGRTLLRIAGLAILFAVLHVPAADAQTRFSFGVGIGSPAPPETARAIAASRQLFERDHAACLLSTDALEAAERQLSQRSRAL